MKKTHLCHNLVDSHYYTILDTLITTILQPTAGFETTATMAHVFTHLCAHLHTHPSCNGHISLLVNSLTKVKVALEQFTNYFVQTDVLLPLPAWAEGTVLSLCVYMCVCVCLCVTTKLL